MQRSISRLRNTRIRKQPHVRRARGPQKPSTEATSIHVRDLPESADESCLYKWCQRTVCKGLRIDQQGIEHPDFIDDIWIGKPVVGRATPADGSTAPQKLRYAHIRFQHEIFKTLMVIYAKPEDFDGISRPAIQEWKSKTARRIERKLLNSLLNKTEETTAIDGNGGSGANHLDQREE